MIYICICFLTCTWYFSRLITSLHRFQSERVKKVKPKQYHPHPQMKIIKKKKNTKKDKETITEKVREWRGVASDNMSI